MPDHEARAKSGARLRTGDHDPCQAAVEPLPGLYRRSVTGIVVALEMSSLQLIVTTQSPDLLDRDDIDVGIVRVANIRAGATIIGQVDASSRQILGEKLATVGQLLRSDQVPG
jgi:hypothetical protein